MHISFQPEPQNNALHYVVIRLHLTYHPCPRRTRAYPAEEDNHRGVLELAQCRDIFVLNVGDLDFSDEFPSTLSCSSPYPSRTTVAYSALASTFIPTKYLSTLLWTRALAQLAAEQQITFFELMRSHVIIENSCKLGSREHGWVT